MLLQSGPKNAACHITANYRVETPTGLQGENSFRIYLVCQRILNTLLRYRGIFTKIYIQYNII